MSNPTPKPEPSTLVIFGAAGDLAHRLLAPALHHLRESALLPADFVVIGVARNPPADREWQFVGGQFEDASLYETLGRRLGSGNVLFYLATPPQFFSPIVRRLGEAGLLREGEEGWRRVIVEKPFGRDLRSAQTLNRALLAVLDESQIYRIDHYLGKETVQNIMVLRFANGLFEPLWNREHIDHVQITVAETVGVEQRGKFYDATGAIRDMVPNHLCELLTLMAMEPPTCFDADALRTEKVKVLEAVHRLVPQNVVRGQYGAGKGVDAYRQAPGVAPQSRTETYVAMKLMIDNWRWVGVPFYLRTGKALTRRRTEIAVQFKQAPLTLFRGTPVEELPSNDLVLHLQPDEGASLRFGAKIPGPQMRIGGVEMTFNYADYFRAVPSTGYETLIYDCMMGDATLFERADTIEGGWRLVQPILDGAQDLSIYEAGSAGPAEADALLARDGRRWRPL
ncbi:MAG TPA: glucose-6-phosphate dehydrogenase [Stellaceae bacterium]|nr:glucose-6-phosphate dehydrogenase [Stellaceae bacterium]